MTANTGFRGPPLGHPLPLLLTALGSYHKAVIQPLLGQDIPCQRLKVPPEIAQLYHILGAATSGAGGEDTKGEELLRKWPR